MREKEERERESKDGAGAGGVQVDKADMLGNGDGGKKKYRVASIGDIAPLEIHVHEATMIVLKQSMVGFFKNIMDYQTLNDRLLLEGQHEVKATFIGGNMVLLQCYCEGELAEVLKFNKQWWNHCFSKIIPWKPNLVSECREIWIDVYGIHLHAWEEGTFKMVAGRFGVFLDFDAATVSKQRLDVARVKLRTVRRGMIDTVVQLKVQGVAYDVWVVAERCRCVEERWYAKEEDGRTDSVRSETNEVKLSLKDAGRQQPSIGAGVNEGIRNFDFNGQNFLTKTVRVSMPGELVEIRHVEGDRDSATQIPRCEAIGERLVVPAVDVGPADEFSNCTLQKGCMLSGEKQHEYGVCDHSLVGPGVMDGGGVSGPVGPQVSHWNPFLDIEDQQAVALHSAHIPNVEEDQ
ncbi:hypothetical protein P8452_76407 [Trifolium repens]|nr:hypothetical protein P8452_76407 [Trifolium repens]